MNAAVETESCRARYDNRYPPPCGPGRVASESRPWPVQSESPVNARGRRARSRRPPPATGWGTYYSSETAGRRAAIFAAAAAQGSGPRDVAPRRGSGAGPSDVTCALARHAGPGAGPWSEIWRRFDGASLGPRRSGSRKTPEERNGSGRGDAARPSETPPNLRRSFRTSDGAPDSSSGVSAPPTELPIPPAEFPNLRRSCRAAAAAAAAAAAQFCRRRRPSVSDGASARRKGDIIFNNFNI